MARNQKNKVAAVELLEEGAQAPESQPEADEAEVEVVEAIAAPKAEKAEKLERFILKEDHSCMIGGKEFSFRKGAEEKAPGHVVSLLRRAGLIAVELK